MKIKPILFENIQTIHTSICVNFCLDNNITFIKGDAGTGKTLVFSILKELAAENKKILCFNYLDMKKNYKTSIKLSKEKLIIVDNADLLLDDNMREYIAGDTKNQYILIGRNPKGLKMSYDEFYELVNSKQGEMTIFSLEKASL